MVLLSRPRNVKPYLQEQTNYHKEVLYVITSYTTMSWCHIHTVKKQSRTLTFKGRVCPPNSLTDNFLTSWHPWPERSHPAMRLWSLSVPAVGGPHHHPLLNHPPGLSVHPFVLDPRLWTLSPGLCGKGTGHAETAPPSPNNTWTPFNKRVNWFSKLMFKDFHWQAIS